MALANPPLNALLCECLGPAWPEQADRWSELERFADDAAFLVRWGACRLEATRRLAQRIATASQLVVDPLHLFDVQVKRIHQCKRQHLNALQVITRYLRIKAGDTAGMAPRTVLFGARAAPGYFMARLIHRFIHGIGEVVNSDPDCRGLLQVVFLPDFNGKLSGLVYPAADLSEQISTAGFEASGSGNMKLAMNGALTIGTLDGANVEIRKRVGDADFFLSATPRSRSLTCSRVTAPGDVSTASPCCGRRSIGWRRAMSARGIGTCSVAWWRTWWAATPSR